MSTDPISPERRRSSLNLRPQPTPSVPGYHVLEVLGAGRNGTVYRAIQLSMQREVALRVLNQRLARVAGFAERFMQEARSAGGVHHPGVVASYDVGQADGQLYLAMELVAGRTLGQVQTTHPQGMAVAHALALVVAATRGLEGIHRGGLMHGDLRLGNLFVTDDESVKLADFGFQRSLEVLRDGSEALADLATLAPEQVSGGQVDIRADLYGMGAVLYVLLTGRQPFTGRSRRELVHAIRSGPSPDPQRLVADLSDELAAVLAKAMAREPSQRYATPGQLREDLERVQYDFVPIHAQPLTSAPIAAVQGSEAVQETLVGRPSPTRTIARGAGFLLVPRAKETRRTLPVPFLVVVGAGVVTLAALAWLGASSRAVPETIADEPAAEEPVHQVTSPAGPRWAAESGSDAHGRWADLTVRGATLRLRAIPAGRFIMGTLDTDPAHRPDEKAVAITFSHGWWLGDSEVTQAFYHAVTGNRPSAFTGDDLPVENLTWHDAVSFTQRLNALVPGLRARLPSEAEWEYACRAGADSTRAGAVTGWFSAPEVTAPRPVKSLPANPWGLYDLQGNVAEWCQDHYGPYPTQPATDPLRLDGVSRVVRGGSWAVDPTEGRPATRGKYLPVAHHAHVGFRIAIDE
jgi:formylglycine-generating enzyme